MSRLTPETVYRLIGWSLVLAGYGAYLLVRAALNRRHEREGTIARLIATDARGKVGEWARHEHLLPRESADMEP